ncbi:MAG TPA: alanine dehydrogenase, partial [Bacteroidota bacterium]|nr:alanine dehydrogenase [Bacteroidota bacterium]
ARSASYGLSNALLPYLTDMVRLGAARAIIENHGLAQGVYTHEGVCTNPAVARRFELEYGHVGSRLN